jgi:hypothetical protein
MVHTGYRLRRLLGSSQIAGDNGRNRVISKAIGHETCLMPSGRIERGAVIVALHELLLVPR